MAESEYSDGPEINLKAGALSAFASRWQSVFSIDLRALAAFRIGLALLVLANLFILAFNLTEFYTDNGIMPLSRWALATDLRHWSIHAASGQLWLQVLLFLLSATAAVCLAIGYRTRLMSILTWVLLVSLINRNHFILQAGDQLLVALSFWAMFLPLNARYSVDAALDPRLQQLSSDAHAQPQRYFSIASIAIILQVLYLYFFTALLKTGDAWRVSLDAAFYAVSLEHFAKPLGVYLRDFPGLLAAATAYVMLVELLAPLLALAPVQQLRLRITAVLLLYSLHIGFLFTLHIGLFPFIDFVALLVLLPVPVWDWLSRISHRADVDKVRIHYDKDCGFCKKTSLIFREFFLTRQVPVLPAQDDSKMGALLERENSWIVTDQYGRQFFHWHAVQFVIAQRIWFKPIAWLLRVPPLLRAGNRLYVRIGDNRRKLSALTARFLPYRELRIRPTWAGQILAGFFLYAVTVTNLVSVNTPGLAAANHVVDSIKLARLDQRWGMFAPKPLMYSLHPVVEGRLRDGSRVDLFNNRAQAPDWTPPANGYSAYPGYRWRKIYERVDGNTKHIRNAYGSFLCKRWNHASRPRAQQLATLEMFSIRRRTNTEGLPKEVSKHSLWQHWCYPEFAPDAVSGDAVSGAASGTDFFPARKNGLRKSSRIM